MGETLRFGPVEDPADDGPSMMPTAVRERMEKLMAEWAQSARDADRLATTQGRGPSDTAKKMRQRVADVRELLKLAAIR